MEGGREGGRKEREGGRVGRREGGKEGGREGEKEGGREGERERGRRCVISNVTLKAFCKEE